MSAQLPTKAEWEAAGFNVPPELCKDERELSNYQIIKSLSRGESDPISDLALEIVDELQEFIQGGNSWCDIEACNIAENLIREFMMKVLNNESRNKKA